MPDKRRNFSSKSFDDWYAIQSQRRGLDPNPYDPRHYYDYKAAFDSGVRGPDKTGHWPSAFKLSGHPREYINGVSTITGEKEPMRRWAARLLLGNYGR